MVVAVGEPLVTLKVPELARPPLRAAEAETLRVEVAGTVTRPEAEEAPVQAAVAEEEATVTAAREPVEARVELLLRVVRPVTAPEPERVAETVTGALIVPVLLRAPVWTATPVAEA